MILPLQVAPPPAANPVFAKAVSVNRQAPRLSAVLKIVTSGKTGTASRQLSVDVIRPDRARLSIVHSGEGAAPTTLTYTVLGTTGYGYERESNAWLKRTLKSGTVAARMEELVGEIDDPVHMLLDPDALKRFFDLMSAGGGWKSAKGAQGTTMTRGSGQSITNFSFDKTGRLVGVKTLVGGNRASTVITYKNPPPAIDFKAPAGAQKVDYFRERPRPPKFVDSGAKQLLNRAINRYWNIKSLQYRVDDFEISYDRGKVRQSTPKAAWAFDGKTLTVVLHGKREVRTGPVKQGEVFDQLRKANLGMENFLRSFWLGRNPIQELAKPDMTARTMGQVTINGMKTGILELKARGIQMQVQIRPDGLISNITSHTLDGKGRVTSTASRTFTYLGIEKSIPPANFSIKPPDGYHLGGP